MLRASAARGEKEKANRMGSRATLEYPVELDRHLCEEEVKRVLHSDAFTKAPRLCSFLLYVCENSLRGRLDELTEQQIGIHVFGRLPGFNSGEDTIVRGTARHLRSRLESYYQEAGRSNPLRISVPKGGYIASFQQTAEAVPAVFEAAADGVLPPPPAPAFRDSLPSPRHEAPFPLRWPLAARVSVVCLSILATALAVLTWRSARPHAPETSAGGPVPLWHALFTEGRRTLIVPGDASLDAYIAWEQRPVSLDQYTNQTYQREITVSQPPSATDVPLSVRSVTPMADLRLVSELVRVPERLGMPQAEKWMEVRYARDLTIGDTHENNLILIGSETFNPWVTLYEPQMDFNVGWDFHRDVYSVTDRAPKAGEPARYEYRRSAPGSKALTLISFLENSQGHGHVLLIQGSSMGTTYSALNFLTNENLWRPAVQAAIRPDGGLQSFEVLLGSDFVRGGVSNTRVIATPVH